MSQRPYSVLTPRSSIDLMVASRAGSLGSMGSTSTFAWGESVSERALAVLCNCAYRCPVPGAQQGVCGAILGRGDLCLGLEHRVDATDCSRVSVGYEGVRGGEGRGGEGS